MPSKVQSVTKVEERVAYDFYSQFRRTWNMDNSDRMALIGLLSQVKPECSIEIGTREGGSLAVISEYSQRVFTLDIDPKCTEAVSHFSNAELTIGDSKETLPGVLKEIEKRQLSLEFVLVDGEHSESGVRDDIEVLLDYHPKKKPCYILMHDSFYPYCREGMRTANWERNPYVHKVDLDFVPGRISDPGEGTSRQMWGGLGLAVMRPEERVGPIQFLASSDHLYNVVFRKSAHRFHFQAKKWLGTERYAGLKKALGKKASGRIYKMVTGIKNPTGNGNA
jgi:cephalosporin hydroxylase